MPRARSYKKQVEAMRPVVEAAINWSKDEGGGAIIDGEWWSVESLCEDLAEAVDRYQGESP